MFCGKCGNMLKDGLRFCPKCGNEIKVKEDVNLYRDDINLEHTDNCVKDNDGNIDSEVLMEAQMNLDKNIEKSSVGTRVLSILLCILLFVFSITAVLVGISRSILKEENIRKLSSKIEVIQVNVNYDNKNIGISEFILEVVSDKLISKYNLTESRVNEIIDNDIIKNHLESLVKP